MQPQSSPPPLPGHLVLDEAAAFLRRFVVFPSAACADACALWAAHTHVVNAFTVSPRLAFLSTEPGSGKTHAMERVGSLCHDYTQEADPTAPALTAMLSQRQPTIGIDEVDTIFGTHGGSAKSSLRSILNAGYRAGASVTRRHGGGYQQDSVYGPVMLAGLGILPSALLTRCVTIRMRPKRPEESAENFIPRVHGPIAPAIGEALGSWARSVALDLAGAWPEMPPGVDNRAAEIWEPLLAIAEQAGESWPRRAFAACLEMTRGAESEPAKSPGQRLLEDLRSVWKNSDGNLPSAELVRRLFALEGSPWRALWPDSAAPRELAALLSPFGVRVSKIRVGDRTAQGYRLADLQAVWPEVPALPAAPADVPDDDSDGTPLTPADVLGSVVPDVPEPARELVSAPPEHKEQPEQPEREADRRAGRGREVKIGYARVSTDDQHPEAQADRLRADGCEKVYTDTGVSGRKASRPQWDACLADLRRDDVLVIVRLDRAGRSVRNLIDVVGVLRERGVHLRVLDQAIDTSTAMGYFFFVVLSALAQMEADLIRERTLDGLAAARARGRQGGRKCKLSPAQGAEVKRLYDERRLTVQEIGELFGLSRRGVYDYVRGAQKTASKPA